MTSAAIPNVAKENISYSFNSLCKNHFYFTLKTILPNHIDLVIPTSSRHMFPRFEGNSYQYCIERHFNHIFWSEVQLLHIRFAACFNHIMIFLAISDVATTPCHTTTRPSYGVCPDNEVDSLWYTYEQKAYCLARSATRFLNDSDRYISAQCFFTGTCSH